MSVTLKSNLTSARRFWSRYGAGYLFVLPTVILYVTFVLYPFLFSLYYSLTKWDGAQPVKEFVGLANYARLLQDRLVWLSLSHNVAWMIGMAFIPVGFGLFLAVLLWDRPPGFLLFRTFYFMPQILGAAVVGIIWRIIYQPRRGVLYQIGDILNWDLLKHSPLASTNTALPAVLVANIWAGIGFFFVIMLAGLQNVNMDLIDAAKVDGANAWQRFWNVVVPQLSHVITMVMVLALIAGLNVFDIIWAMTGGGPANATEVIGTYTYKKFVMESQVGYAAALTMLMTFLALITTVAFIRLRERGEA